MSVQGKLKPGDLGHTLIHEHVTTDFIGAEKVAQPQYELEDALPVVLPHFQKLKALGINTLVECTPNYIGRDVRLLQEISERSGIHIITNTGYYAAVDKKYLPRHAFEEDAETIAARWQKEWEEGIDGTPIRPGFIKLGVGQGPLDEIEEKLLVAGIQLSKKSGLPIYVHTGDGAAAQSEYDILTREGLAPDQLIWVHAQNGTDEERIALANKGVWVSLDGVNVSRLDQYVHMIQAMKSGGVLSHLLVSHDDGWSVEKEGGQIKLKGFGFGDGMPYVTISEQLIPKLQKAGFTEGEIKQIMIQNPRTALSIRRSSNKMVAHE
jgi:phosphotriesterase-related protein